VKTVIQRVSHAQVTVEDAITGSIDGGLLVLLGVGPDDGERQALWMANKIANLRIFADDDGKMNRSLLDTGGGALVISQFTLYGDCRKGRRPSYNRAAHPDHAEPLYERFCEALAALGVPDVQRGVFGAHMDVQLLNSGPVTLILETPSE
jgi:D-tyrosyl-tRNA(Tyr) deacylase